MQWTFQSWDSDNSAMFDCDQKSPKGMNVFRLCDSELDAVDRAGYLTFDRAARAKQYAAVQRILYRDAPWVPLWTMPNINIYTRRLKNFVGTPAWNPYYRTDDWYLAPN